MIRVAVEALYDAADDDSATGGPDLVRRIFPVIMLATAEGVTRVPDEQVGTLAEAVVAERTANPI
jgi:proteasome beta subunit